MIDAYRDTMLHLRHHGLLAAPCLAEMQVLWRRGGDDRRLAAEIAARWELARMRPNELSPAQRPWLWRVVS